MIRLSLPETEEHDAISLSGKGDLIQNILRSLRMTSDSLILTSWSITTASNNLLPHI